MKLGVAYNVYDGEELLLDSIRSIKSNVDYICVVYQTVSNFGNSAHPDLEKRLQFLVDNGYVDELYRYEAKLFTNDEKEALCSPMSNELGGPPAMVSNQFFNELTKRELGRQMCAAKNCTHFMSMDTDEFYREHELAYAKAKILKDDLDGTSCKMRFYFKEPNYELLPFDEYNQVPLIYKIKPGAPLLLAHPYPCIVDPTRRMSNCQRFYQFSREEIEMHHFSFVRADMSSKMKNVSNRDNHDGSLQFLRDFQVWTPEVGVIHPHPWGRKVFKFVSRVPNRFKVDLSWIDRL
uniref:Glycosyltransferase family 92 protein n=1 Tax=Hanusia phi TaxID=3032 RepID=A0A7S0HM32_9CRYP